MVRVADVSAGNLQLETCLTVSLSDYHKYTAKHIPTYGDIVISRVGTYGVFAYVNTKRKFCLGQNTAILSPRINSKYLYYCLNSPGIKKQIDVAVVGSTQKTISLKNIKSLIIPRFGELIEARIADYLSLLDDKIENNKRINENLAQQAQAIYADIFITNADPAWPLGHLSDLIIVRYGKDHKKLDDGPFPVYGSGGVMRYVERPIYEKESVLIPRKGTLNNVMYVNEPFWSVDTMFFTEMKLPDVAKFVFHFIKSKDLASLNAGSAVPSMTTAILNAMELCIPDAETLKRFESIVSPMYKAMQHNTEESKKLAAVRDSLLPRLMSGELDVSELDL